MEKQFRKELTDEQLIDCIDVMAYGEGGWRRDIGDYQVELTRRETERQNQRLEALTETLVVLTQRLHRLTVWVVVLTIVLVVLELLRIAGVVH